jgi:hypothetical protein
MEPKTRALIAAAVLVLLASSVAAQPAWIGNLRRVAYALGWLMMVFMGLRWIIADSPNDRADAKKGMIYIVIGLLVVASACDLLSLYCTTAQSALPTFTDCDPSTYCS